MRIKQNPLIKGLVALMIAVPIYMLATSGKEKEEERSASANEQNGKPQVTESEEIAALSGYLSTVEDQQKALVQQMQNVVTKDDIAAMVKDAVPEIKGQAVDYDALTKSIETIVNKKTKALEEAFLANNSIAPNQVGSADDEMPFSEEFEIGGSGNGNSNKNASEEIQWAYPVGYQVEEKGVIDGLLDSGSAFGDSAGKFAFSAKQKAGQVSDTLQEELKPIPYATIHADSSIHGATALTALIGRIEKDGKTQDPYRFQVVLSGDTLMANGLQMPGVANAIVTGQATGDRAFKCVRGSIISLTFNFEDGRIFNQKGTFEEPIALIGDKWGNPCVRGTLVDDVEKHIVAQGVVGGLSSYAKTIANQQQTVTSSGNSTAIDLTGDAGKLALGSFAEGGLNKTSEILADRYDSYYEAVYVAPSETVSLLFIQDVAIDYVPTNRKVSYEENYTLTSSLD